MIYIYDVVVNFNDVFYPFYDWLETDVLEHIRRIPIIKVKEKEIQDFINNEVIINKKHLDLLYNKTEVFNDEKIEKIRYSCLLGSNNNVIAVIFDNNGNVKELSSLILDEELEILEIIKTLKTYNLQYLINRKKEKNTLLREEEKIVNQILTNLKMLRDSKKEELLEYLYYEWFDKKPEKKYYNTLVNSIKRKYTDNHIKFLDLLELVKNT